VEVGRLRGGKNMKGISPAEAVKWVVAIILIVFLLFVVLPAMMSAMPK
jgi:hypothetical protein